jgi:hypothetical protein
MVPLAPVSAQKIGRSRYPTPNSRNNLSSEAAIVTASNRQYLLAQRPTGALQENDFTWTESDVPEIGPDEVLVRSIYLSLDPANRGWFNDVATYRPPVGLGEPVFDRLDADLAHGLMSINAVKGIEIGAGFGCIAQRGSEHRDEMTPEGFLSNHAGGVLGGISSGQPIVARLALKPTSSITTPGRSIDVHGEPVEVITKGRHDPCVGIRATPIAEAMMAITLLDHWLRHRGQNADVSVDTPRLGQR